MLEINGCQISPRLIVFDKDGTLIAFDEMWKAWFSRFTEYINDRMPLRLETRVGLAGILGYDLVDEEWDPLGPLTLASTSEIMLLVAGQLYHYEGMTWDEALEVVREAEQAGRGALADDTYVAPIGDVRGMLDSLSQHGYRMALATTDTREATMRHLSYLGIEGFFETVICGDDGVPLKPEPDMVQEICRRLAVHPHQTVMIGDSVADMTMARRAELGAAIGVGSGAMPVDMLQDSADCVIEDIHAIRIMDGAAGIV